MIDLPQPWNWIVMLLVGREKVVIGRVPRPVNQWGVEKDRKDPPAGAREHPSTH
jgi:hypothetical protein